MKNIYSTFIAVIFLINITATNYYISSTDPLASDGNSGTSILAPWASFAPLNLISSYSAGDTVFLKCGDVFRGQININNATNVVFTSYGTGNKPIISGADSVLSWTLVGGSYQANFTQPVFNFFVNDVEQILARYPDDGSYLTIDAATINYLQDADLTSISSAVLNASQVCVHTTQWSWEKSEILSSAGNQINYLVPTLLAPTANYGYFLYDDTTYLTIAKEWMYDAIGMKIYYIPSTGSPNTLNCEASVRPYGILMGSNVSNISIVNIAFEKQSESGISIANVTNTNIIVDDCYFARQYKYGVEVYGKNAEITNSYFREVDGLAVYLYASATKAEVHHNTFRNNGGFRNSGIGEELNLTSIMGAFTDSCHIHHNNIDSAGYCGISMDGKWNLIERNIIKNVMLLNNDGAALKSFGTSSQYNTFKNNFVSLGDGNTAGTPPGYHFVTPAIYFDLSVNNCTIQQNTIYDRENKGIFLNSGTNNNTVIENVVYGGNFCLDFNGSPLIPTPMTGMVVKYNSLFAKDDNAYIIRMVDNTGSYGQGIIDSNYYFQPYNASKYALLPALSADYTFAQWQATGFDQNTKSSFVNWTLPTSYDTLFMNPTDDIVTISLGTTEYLDLDSNIVCESITLQPYTSKILINNIITCSTLALPENEYENNMSIFPNPSSTELTIKTNDKTKTLFKVIDQLGQTVATGYLINGAATTDITSLRPGLYFVQKDGIIIQTKKLIKI